MGQTFHGTRKLESVQNRQSHDIAHSCFNYPRCPIYLEIQCVGNGRHLPQSTIPGDDPYYIFNINFCCERFLMNSCMGVPQGQKENVHTIVSPVPMPPPSSLACTRVKYQQGSGGEARTKQLQK